MLIITSEPKISLSAAGSVDEENENSVVVAPG